MKIKIDETSLILIIIIIVGAFAFFGIFGGIRYAVDTSVGGVFGEGRIIKLINNLNQTQTQLSETIDWIRKNSEERDILGYRITQYCQGEIVINNVLHQDELVSNCKSWEYDFTNITHNFLIGTNISTERFFR